MDITPIIFVYTDTFENQIYMKREDLIPFSFGGNKVRIAQEFLADMELKGKNCIIGYGNARSNLSRALAGLCSARGIPCHIISPSDEDGSRIETFNSRMVKSCNVVFHECAKTAVAQAVDEVTEFCIAQGLSPYYIYGDRLGKGNEAVPVNAYAKVYRQIAQQSEAMGTLFDYIFQPTGTGMTQAGLLAGQCECGGKEQIIGISVARRAAQEEAVIANMLSAYGKAQNIEINCHGRIHVADDYLRGGYGEFDCAVQETVTQAFTQWGIPLDPVYTGKAFWGMCSYIRENDIRGKKILFIHTGGTPLFFDFWKPKRKKPEIIDCKDPALLAEFLRAVDIQLPTPLSKRVDLDAYAEKVVSNGHALTVQDKGKIVSAMLFYCNDLQSRMAYATLLGTLQEYEGNGYGKILMDEMEVVARDAGMKAIHFHTEIGNLRAVSFHSKQGYHIDEVAEKLHMVKEI